MEILRQLAELFLQAVPTVVIVFLFYLFLRFSFFQPIERAMAERHARIEGARAKAAASLATAKEKQEAHREALKKARTEIYAEQEAARQAVLDERAKLLRERRNQAREEIHAAKERIAADFAAARAELEKQSPALASEIVRAILERRPTPVGSETR
jgi:F0F1-type ATP synthase membrane subunit b/b'